MLPPTFQAGDTHGAPRATEWLLFGPVGSCTLLAVVPSLRAVLVPCLLSAQLLASGILYPVCCLWSVASRDWPSATQGKHGGAGCGFVVPMVVKSWKNGGQRQQHKQGEGGVKPHIA